MAGELRHGPALPVAEQLSQSEWESTGAHVIESGQPGDLLVFDGAKLVRLPLGANGTFLGIVAGEHAYVTPGGVTTSIVHVTSNYVIEITDDAILVDTTAGNINLTLPAADDAYKPVTIKKITNDVNTVTVVPAAGDQIENAVSLQYPGGFKMAYTLWPDPVSTPDMWWVT